MALDDRGCYLGSDSRRIPSLMGDYTKMSPPYSRPQGCLKDDMGGVAGGEESPTLRLLL